MRTGPLIEDPGPRSLLSNTGTQMRLPSAASNTLASPIAAAAGRRCEPRRWLGWRCRQHHPAHDLDQRVGDEAGKQPLILAFEGFAQQRGIAGDQRAVWQDN